MPFFKITILRGKCEYCHTSLTLDTKDQIIEATESGWYVQFGSNHDPGGYILCPNHNTSPHRKDRK